MRRVSERYLDVVAFLPSKSICFSRLLFFFFYMETNLGQARKTPLYFSRWKSIEPKEMQLFYAPFFMIILHCIKQFVFYYLLIRWN